MKYRSWKLPEDSPNPKMLRSSLNFIIPCLDASTLLAGGQNEIYIYIYKIVTQEGITVQRLRENHFVGNLVCVLTQVDDHGVHSNVLLDEQMGVSAKGVKDG